jgi:squalene-hopene/tetraprenyl-beta-curcumene cyclase
MVRILGVCLLFVATGAAAGAEPKESEYEGKPLSQWLRELAAKDRATYDRAVQAVSAILRTDASRGLARRCERRASPADSLLLVNPELVKEHSGQLTPVLAGLLRDADPVTRLHAAHVLAVIGTKAAAAVPVLRAALEDKDGAVCQKAAVALAKVDPKEVESMIAFLLKRAGSAGRANVSGDLTAIGTDAVPHLVPALAHPDAATRDQVINALWSLGEPAAAAVIKALSAETPALRAGAARCLGRMDRNNPNWLPAMRAALSDSEREVRLTAAEGLGKADVAATLPVLIEVLAAGETPERGRAVVAVRSLGEQAGATAQAAVPTLEKMLQTKDGALDLDVADALVHIEPARAKRVAELLGPKTVAGQNEVGILVRIGRATPEGLPAVVLALARILRDPTKGTAQQREAVHALAQFGAAAKAAVPDLIAVANGKNQDLKRLAARTVALLDPEATDYPRDLQSPPYNPNEALRQPLSVAKAADYLDVAAQDWMRPNSCAGCHANFAYMMVRPLLKTETLVVADTRKFLEEKIEKQPKGRFTAEAVTSAAALAFDDARTGKLRQVTRQALDRMWTVLPVRSCNDDGIVVELTPDYCAALAIVAAGVAPDKYAQTEKAQRGLAATRKFLCAHVKENGGASLNSEALLLWAAAYQPDLLTGKERTAIIQALLAQQRPDGGWSSAALDRESRKSKNNDLPSDGYGTGFTVYVLRQAGVAESRPEIGRAVNWLRNNQRASGRWFTPSRHAGQTTTADFGTRDLYNQVAGTAFALLALESCGALHNDDTATDAGAR